MRTAAALIIGNEILSGKTVDTNTPFLARELRALGVDLRRVVVVPDLESDIIDGLRQLIGRHDVVFTSGGIGPTHDDITLRSVAAALGRPLVRDAEIEALIRAHFDEGSREAALRMADVPQGASLLFGEGQRVPVVVVDNIYVLPGLPSIFEKKVVALREHLRDEPFHLRLVYLDADETAIADTLFRLVERHPDLQVGSYPEPDGPAHRVKLTLESKDGSLVERALEELLRALPREIVVRVS